MHIFWLPEQFLKLPGHLGIGHAPGMGRETAKQDLQFLKVNHAHTILCLQQEHEFNFLEPPETLFERKERLQSLNIELLHDPIEDFCAPSLEQIERINTQIAQRLNTGKNVFVHCMFGLGRAGTIAACFLVFQGMSAQGAISMVRWIRAGAIQSSAQENMIHSYAAHLERFGKPK
jgi:predicted protein tyrosine phosphatase